MADTNYYYDFNHPLPVVELALKLLGKSADPTTPLSETGAREWFSQPREGRSTETECVTVAFREPVVVSEVSTEVLRMPCRLEVWYQDRSDNWRPVLDRQRIPLSARVSIADTKDWHKFQARCYPVVAKRVQLRLTRTPDPVTLDVAYPVGVRNTLIRRNVYDRHDAGFFEDETDVMGNLVTKYVRDWDATKAADDNYTTFWKSAPQPDPAAVVSLYLDVRDAEGNAQIIDKLWIDPVYTGQHVNVYHSTDETVGTRTLSPVTVQAAQVSNATWRRGQGLRHDTGQANSIYSWPLAVGVHDRQPGWVGVEWEPDFDPSSGAPPNDPVLFAAGAPVASDGTAVSPVLRYDAAGMRFVLTFYRHDPDEPDGTTIAAGPYYTEPVTDEWQPGETVRVVAGWNYAASGGGFVHLRVVDGRSRTIAQLDDTFGPGVADRVSLDGTARVADFHGTITNLVVKLEDFTTAVNDFLANPTYYTDPDPVIPDDRGRYPSTSLDNAVYAAPFASREHGVGGADVSSFDKKEWTPVWRNYVATKGMMYLPQATAMKYLKLEFTNLSEEPYPIYESGIEVRYKVFPIEVIKQSSIGPRLYTGAGGFLGMGTFISMNGVRSVNWLDPNSVLTAIGSVLGPQVPPVIVNVGKPYITDSLPNQGATAVEESRRVEAASSYVYARDSLQPYVLAADQYNTIIRAEGLQTVQPFIDIPWDEIQAANPGAVTKVKSTGTVPIRGTDWWIYPGQQLKVPAAVMRKITDTDTVTERKLTYETRTRFTTTSVHRYEYRTVKRDAAIAYFAGVREVQPYTSTYVRGEDRPVLDFPTYDPRVWVFQNTVIQPDGTVVAAYPTVPGVISSEFETQSDFSRISVTFNDSRLVRSDSMWADTDANVEMVDDLQLAPYVNTIPLRIPTGTWADFNSAWTDLTTVWGSTYGLVNVTRDGEKRFMGRRALKFTRAGGTDGFSGQGGRGGVSVDQWTNITPGAKFRMGCVVYRPEATDNRLVLTMRRLGDGVRVYEEYIDDVPVGRWSEHVTNLVEIPETLPFAGFENGFQGWITTGGGIWSVEDDDSKTRTGGKAARLVTSSVAPSSLSSTGVMVTNGTTVKASAWVRWQGLATGSTEPVIRLRAVFTDNAGDEVASHDFDNAVTPATADQASWTPVSGEVPVPDGVAADKVSFEVVVEESAGNGGTVWVDDFTVDVPLAPRQQYQVQLTLQGDKQEELYIADLYTEVTPIRYFIQLGSRPGGLLDDEPVVWDEPIEVTDLRYTRDNSTVTRTLPANAFRVRAVITNTDCKAVGARIVPAYLK